MERRSFDFERLMKPHEKKHKQKPAQFESVASGVQKRMEIRLKSRKSNRCSIFDSIRNLSRSSSPAPVSEAQQKLAHRLQQLERWKEEKEKKKKEAAAKKKKPFLAGVPHTSHKYVPPPLPPTKPSTSGRVTRSQTVRNTVNAVTKSEKALSQSFAPKNATFKPPELKTNSKVPFVSLVPLKQVKSKVTFTFDPVPPKKKDKPVPIKEVRPTRSRTQIKKMDIKVVKNKAGEEKNNTKNIKTIVTATSKTSKFNPQSSSSCETDLTISFHKTFQSTSSTDTDSSMPLQKPIQGSSSSDTESSVSLQKPLQSFSSSETDVSMSLLPRDRKSLNQLQSKSTESESSPVHSNTKDKSPNQRRTRQSIRNPDSPIFISKTPRKSVLSASDQTTPKNQVPKSESSSEERLRPSKSPLDVERTPEQIIEDAKRISPCVTMSRGKDNARREMKKKLDEGLLDVDTADVDNIDHFRRQLASEIKRMTEMCELWDKVLEQAALPESVQEKILAAVGQCRLLMSQKLQQFASLVERCARPEPGTALVTPADLHGFWDMVFMQIENVDIRFKKLEELRARDWTEEQTVVVVAKKKVAKATKAKPTGGASRIKEMIAAARKAQKSQLSVPAPAAAPPGEKSFEAGFFCVKSPIRSPAPATPRGKMPTLLKAVLSSEAKKSASKNSASYAMLRASVMGKNVDFDGISPLPQTPLPTNMNATPGRSILKKATASNTKMSPKKVCKVVLFDQSGSELNTSFNDQPIETSDSYKSLDEPIETADLTTSLNNQPIATQEQPKGNVDSGMSSMEIEREEKENLKRTPRLTRQGALDIPHRSPMMTRSRRKSIATPQEMKNPPAHKKTPQVKKTPQENKKTPQVKKTPQENKKTPQEDMTPQSHAKGRRSTRKAKVLVDVLNDL